MSNINVGDILMSLYHFNFGTITHIGGVKKMDFSMFSEASFLFPCPPENASKNKECIWPQRKPCAQIDYIEQGTNWGNIGRHEVLNST